MSRRIVLLMTLWLTGCASHIPPTISEAPAPDLRLTQVAGQAASHLNRPARWGGTILKVNNRAADTEIELLAMPLDYSGRPLSGDRAEGRFLARLAGFQDPAVFAPGRQLTLYGLIGDEQSRNIGKKPYAYPVLNAQAHYLWPREPDYASAGYCGYGYGGYYRPYGYYRSGFYPRRYGYGFYGRYGGYW